MILHDAFHANGGSPPPVLTKLLHCCQGNCVLLLSLSCSFSLSCIRSRHGAFEWNVVLACSCTLENWTQTVFIKAAHFVWTKIGCIVASFGLIKSRDWCLHEKHVCCVSCRCRHSCNKCRTSSRPCRTRSSGEISCLFDLKSATETVYLQRKFAS